MVIGALVIAFFLVHSDFFGFTPENLSDDLAIFCNDEQYSKIDSNLRKALCDT